MSELDQKKCVPCEGGVAKLQGELIDDFMSKIESEWKAVDEHQLERNYKFPNFKTALEFVNNIGEVAEQEGHHPNIDFTYGKVKITIYTHAIDGLSENDFILAAKIDKIKR